MGIHALYTAATGMDAQLKNIDVIANNVANLETAGFRKDRVNFADLFYRQETLAGGSTTSQGVSPTGIHIGHGVKVVSTEKLFNSGGMIPTNNPFNVAIEGNENVFFRVQRPNGELAYTRAGNFQLDEQGQMVTPQGDLLSPPVQVGIENADGVQISKNGLVTANDGLGETAQVGQILVYRFINPSGLRPDGDNLFFESGASGAAQELTPADPGAGRLLSGYVEGSNVNAINELVNLIKGQRAYEINSNVIETADEALQIANNLRG